MINGTTFTGEYTQGLAVVKYHVPGMPEPQALTPYHTWPTGRGERTSSAVQLRPSGVGFSWGYSGSGPHCLATAILLRVFRDDQTAMRLAEAFAKRFVSMWPLNYPWTITDSEIVLWANQELGSVPSMDAASEKPSAFVRWAISGGGNGKGGQS